MLTSYLTDVIKQFEYYKSLGERTFEQLSDEELLQTENAACNSVAVIVNHLHGNMLSRWTNFLNEDGEKQWRTRDQEFEPIIKSRNEMLAKWNEGWQCLFHALEPLSESDLHKTVLIRNQEHSVVEAINRQMMHYAYHVGQIVFMGKIKQGENWKSLSIPKGKSKAFNQAKTSKGKHGGHFTDELLK